MLQVAAPYYEHLVQPFNFFPDQKRIRLKFYREAASKILNR